MESNKLSPENLKKVNNLVKNFNLNLNKSRVVKKDMGKNEFLKILTVQLSHQNPLEPMDNTQFISQMAQFTSLEQLQNMNNTLKDLKGDFVEAKGAGLIGKKASFLDVNGTMQEGIIEEVKLKNQNKVVIGDNEVELKDLFSIKQNEKIAPYISSYEKNIKETEIK